MVTVTSQEALCKADGEVIPRFKEVLLTMINDDILEPTALEQILMPTLCKIIVRIIIPISRTPCPN